MNEFLTMVNIPREEKGLFSYLTAVSPWVRWDENKKKLRNVTGSDTIFRFAENIFAT